MVCLVYPVPHGDHHGTENHGHSLSLLVPGKVWTAHLKIQYCHEETGYIIFLHENYTTTSL